MGKIVQVMQKTPPQESASAGSYGVLHVLAVRSHHCGAPNLQRRRNQFPYDISAPRVHHNISSLNRYESCDISRQIQLQFDAVGYNIKKASIAYIAQLWINDLLPLSYESTIIIAVPAASTRRMFHSRLA